MLQIDKFEGADFKYDNSFLNSSPKIPKKGTFGPKVRDIHFSKSFAVRQI